ncbi:MAG: hypothetical protein ACI31E_05985 [Muribaculaceae bacterium]
MSQFLEYDDTNLRALLDALTPEHRYKGFRRVLNRQGRKLRAAVVRQVMSKVKGYNKDMEKCVRMKLYTKKAVGFRVTVGESGRGKGAKGYYITTGNLRRAVKRYGEARAIPLLRWMDTGTAPRSTSGTGVLHRNRRSTGALPRYGFIAAASAEVGGEVVQGMGNEIIKTFEKIAKKYGCKV